MIGVLALQGDVREHIRILEAMCTPVEVRNPDDLEGLKGLIVPGGESTTIWKLIMRVGLDKAIRKRVKEGMGYFGTCAGAILAASKIIDKEEGQKSLNLLDMTIQRNSYGRQLQSFETDIKVRHIGRIHVFFIRAPSIVKTDAEVLAELDRKPVLVRKGKVLISMFHPEIAGETRLHKMFLDMCR